jgi:GMP synthase (glutamine-hydrolysing)
MASEAGDFPSGVLGLSLRDVLYSRQSPFIANAKSGLVVAGTVREYGHADLKAKRVNRHVDRLFEGLEDDMKVWMSHGDKLSQLPEGFHVVASTANSE